ncbi:CocE/NonD family hydrolase [Amphibacillus cookii]|uniref:CocE/NonD family hydrolase n=1 Tax=Amphibacillus cookii TaxID=767787 RepID=UPI00195A4C3D|nr:CocE/NonD family hydrolase [Amphibacillus cookii]MBM7539973.1 putative CocE/NonD family hydrolase [Amphibacillus cookii]
MVFNIQESDKRRKKVNFPRDVEKREHIFIPMSDGKKLAATIWLPTDAEDKPVPALLEYLPYRKNDFTAIRDSARHPYFAGHGYASIRVDIRGAGDSDDLLLDEYLKQEQDDALDILDWIVKQPWSTGKVGMFGKSWGGFNSLQVAARQHPALKTIITLCSTDDRYRDDVHYRGGNILASDMLWWASTMFAYNARPQDPEVVGDRWRDNWIDRIENTPPFVEEWLRHQRRDDYWKHGSICEDYTDVNIPVFAVGGWQDAYTDPIFRMLEHLPQAKGLIGPWAHEYPEVATPEPAIGFLQEALRWWDYWLKDIDTGIMDEPKLTAWVQNSEKPEVSYDERPGRWIGEVQWPSPAVDLQKSYLIEQQLVSEQPRETAILVPSVQEHGFYAGTFCPFGQPGDLPADQRLENGKAITFTSKPLTETTDYLGEPIFHGRISVDQENAMIVVRLMDKAPSGESTLISWGMLNLNHYQSHEHPVALEPGKQYDMAVKLNALGQQIPVGHCLEVAIAPTYWTKAWPSPKPVNLTLYTGEGTYIDMPVRKEHEADNQVATFDAPETAAIMEREILRTEERTYDIIHQPIDSTWKVIDYSDEGSRRLPTNGLEYGSINKNTYTIRENDPLTAKAQCEWELTVGRGNWQTKLVTYSEMTADLDHFYLVNTITAYEHKQEVTTKTWKTTIARDFN